MNKKEKKGKRRNKREEKGFSKVALFRNFSSENFFSFRFLSSFSLFLLLPYLFGVITVFAAEETPFDFDYLIHQAIVFDGQSIQGRNMSVGIKKDRIVALGDLKNKTATYVIDAKGLTLAPGFIDAHTHSDFNPIIYPSLSNKAAQGVTTEIVGNCGMSAAPVLGSHSDQIRSVWAREGVMIPARLPWATFSEYRKKMESSGMVSNFAGLVGHGNLRFAVMGMSPKPASPSELQAMKSLLIKAMEDGAYGISYGLVYLPGVFAQPEEIIDLCREAARHLGVCSFHMRSEGGGLIEAIKEVIEVAEKAQANVQISHLKAAGKNNWEKIHLAFKYIEKARDRGVRISVDAYPYEAGYAELGVMLPDALYQRQDRLDYFRDFKNRKEILNLLRAYDEEKKFYWDRVMIASTAVKSYQKYEGMTFKQIAREENVEPEKFLMNILIDTSFEVSAFYFTQNPEIVKEVIAKPYVAIGSDSIADGTRRPHPRAYGAFPRIFREYVQEEKSISLAEAIRKMTSLPADHFGLQGRGRIRVGNYADLVLFDAEDIQDGATYQQPVLPNQGIKWVFVNGRPVLEKGKATGEKPGQFLINRG